MTRVESQVPFRSHMIWMWCETCRDYHSVQQDHVVHYQCQGRRIDVVEGEYLPIMWLDNLGRN